jgi:hypothetical protein
VKLWTAERKIKTESGEKERAEWILCWAPKGENRNYINNIK